MRCSCGRICMGGLGVRVSRVRGGSRKGVPVLLISGPWRIDEGCSPFRDLAVRDEEEVLALEVEVDVVAMLTTRRQDMHGRLSGAPTRAKTSLLDGDNVAVEKGRPLAESPTCP